MERAAHLRERDSEASIGRQLAAKRTEGMHFNFRESASEQVGFCLIFANPQT